MARDQSPQTDKDCPDPWIDHKIAVLADRQHGPIHHDQLIALGLRRWQIKYRVKTKRLCRVHPLVYTVGYRELDDLGAWAAAVLAAGDGAAVACRSAGRDDKAP